LRARRSPSSCDKNVSFFPACHCCHSFEVSLSFSFVVRTECELALSSTSMADSSKEDQNGESSLTAEEELERDDGRVTQIRNVCNANRIKLWMKPYVKEDGQYDDDALVELANTLASSLDNMDVVLILEGLKTLQQRAIDKLAAKAKLTGENKFRLRLRLAKGLVSQDEVAPEEVEVDPSATGEELAAAVGRALPKQREGASLRLICSGRVLDRKSTLVEQGVKPGWAVMAVAINSEDASLKIVEEQRRYLESTKCDAEMLAEGDDNAGLSVADQSGKALELPMAEKKALIIAMSLHEKGKAALKRSNHELALVFLLEAAQSFENVPSELLARVDNYGLLNLDIAWCYVQLNSINQLDDAVSRLDACNRSFEQVYGANLERLQAVKGSTGNERALYLRMHILQAIAQYHSGNPGVAKKRLRQARKELEELDVPRDAIGEWKTT